MTSPAAIYAASNVIKSGRIPDDAFLAIGDLLDAIGEDVQTGRPCCPVDVLALTVSVVAAVDPEGVLR